MEVFVRVAEAGSFTKAAESLPLPKASVSATIQALENHLGVKLLNRTTRHVSLTPDGAAYYERCLRILADVRETEEAMRHLHGSPSGQVRAEVPSLLARLVVIPALSDFFGRYPDIRVELSSGDVAFDLVESGIDCGVFVGELSDERIVARRVGLVHVATGAAPSYLARFHPPAHPADLTQHRCIGLFAPGATAPHEWEFSRGGERVTVAVSGVVSVNDLNAHLAAAESGLGIARLPAFVLKEAMDRGTLEPVLGEWVSDPAPLQVIYPEQRHLSAKVRVFVDWIAALFEQHDAIQLRSLIGAGAAARRRPPATPA